MGSHAAFSAFCLDCLQIPLVLHVVGELYRCCTCGIHNYVTSVNHRTVCDIWCVVVAGIAIQTSTNTVDLRGQRSSVAMMALEDAMGELYSLGTIYISYMLCTGWEPDRFAKRCMSI